MDITKKLTASPLQIYYHPMLLTQMTDPRKTFILDFNDATIPLTCTKKKWSDFLDLTPNKQITQIRHFVNTHTHTHKRKHEAFMYKKGIATSSRCACTLQAVMLPSTDPGWAGLWTWTTTWSEWRARSSTRKPSYKPWFLFVDRKTLKKKKQNRVIRCTLSAR